RRRRAPTRRGSRVRAQPPGRPEPRRRRSTRAEPSRTARVSCGEAYGNPERNFSVRRVSKPVIVEGVARILETVPGKLPVKQARVVGWSDVGGREAALVQRCAAGDEAACADLVAEHQRMVVQLAMNLLGDREEALDLSQEVFLRVFRTIHRFRGQSSLRTWIYRIAVNQARN